MEASRMEAKAITECVHMEWVSKTDIKKILLGKPRIWFPGNVEFVSWLSR